MNYGVAVPTPKVHSTLDQRLASWGGSGDYKVDSHVDQLLQVAMTNPMTVDM